MKKTQILLDTDIGDDIDDALALALALESLELEIVGITTVFKNVKARAALALSLLEMYDREEIKVYAGIGQPINNKVELEDIPVQCIGLEDKVYDIQAQHGVDFIIETVSKNPEVIIVPIGPLTNIAIAYLKAPEVMKKAKVVLMGGDFTHNFPEWNILCDPEAAKIVVESGMNIHMIGLDVTTQCTLTTQEIQDIRENERPQVKFLASLIQKWIDATGYGVTLHDPLVIGYLLNEEFIDFEGRAVKVALQGDEVRGMTLIQANPFEKIQQVGPIQIATAVKNKEFTNLFLERVFYRNKNK